MWPMAQKETSPVADMRLGEQMCNRKPARRSHCVTALTDGILKLRQVAEKKEEILTSVGGQFKTSHLRALQNPPLILC
jgi:hypothetical protein